MKGSDGGSGGGGGGGRSRLSLRKRLANHFPLLGDACKALLPLRLILLLQPESSY